MINDKGRGANQSTWASSIEERMSDAAPGDKGTDDKDPEACAARMSDNMESSPRILPSSAPSSSSAMPPGRTPRDCPERKIDGGQFFKNWGAVFWGSFLWGS